MIVDRNIGEIDEALQALLEMIEDEAERNKIIPAAIIRAIVSRLDDERLPHIPLQSLARCLIAQHQHRRELIGLAQLAAALWSACEGTLSTWKRDALPSVITALREIDYERFAPYISGLALNAQAPPPIRGAAIQSLGRSLRRKGERAEAVARKLIEFLSDDDEIIRTAALAALAENDPVRLLGVGRSNARDELARISAETGQLFFQDFMIDRQWRRVEALG